MSSRTLISAQTGAANGTFGVHPGEVKSVYANGLAGAETVQFYISNDGGTTYQLLKYAGSTVQLDVNNTLLKFDAPGFYKAAKSSTAGSVPVYINEGQYI